MTAKDIVLMLLVLMIGFALMLQGQEIARFVVETFMQDGHENVTAPNVPTRKTK